MSATVTFYGKMLNVGCFVLLKVWKKGIEAPTNQQHTLPVSVSISLLVFGVYPLWVTQINRHSSMFYEKWQSTRPPCDPHWQAEVYYRKHVIWREITVSCLSLIDYEERNHSVCSLKNSHTQPLFTSDTPTRAGAGIYSLQNCSRLTSGLLRKK